MNPEDLGRALGRMEGSLDALHRRFDELTPACGRHNDRLEKLEGRANTQGGALYVLSGIYVLIQGVFFVWFKKKVGE